MLREQIEAMQEEPLAAWQRVPFSSCPTTHLKLNRASLYIHYARTRVMIDPWFTAARYH